MFRVAEHDRNLKSERPASPRRLLRAERRIAEHGGRGPRAKAHRNGGRRSHSLTLAATYTARRRAAALRNLLLHQFLDELVGGVVDADFEGEVAGEGMGGATGTQILTCPYKPVLSL